MLVLVPGRDATARLCEQSLIMIDVDAFHAEQIGHDCGKSARQDESSHSFVFRPQIHSL
jgi:hypothetical protein